MFYFCSKAQPEAVINSVAFAAWSLETEILAVFKDA